MNSKLSLLAVIFYLETCVVHADGRMDVLPPLEPPKSIRYYQFTGSKQNISIPETYNWKDDYPACAKQPVEDSGACAASWATITASTASDRACMAKIPTFGSSRILSCCKNCGAGCYGGYPWLALEYLKASGVPDRRCQTLKVRPSRVRSLTPTCRPNCEKGVNNAGKLVRRKIKDYYRVSDSNVKLEILTNGPVISYVDWHSSLLDHKKEEVFVEIPDDTLQRKFTVKLFGWGVDDNGSEYWMAENSWGTSWGDKGSFRILKDDINGNSVVQAVFGIKV